MAARDSSYMTTAEKEKAERAALFAVLKARDSLGTYYQLYPDEKPKGWDDRNRQDEGRER